MLDYYAYTFSKRQLGKIIKAEIDAVFSIAEKIARALTLRNAELAKDTPKVTLNFLIRLKSRPK